MLTNQLNNFSEQVYEKLKALAEESNNQHAKQIENELIEIIQNISQEKINEKDSSGKTALHWAAEYNNNTIASELIEKGVDVNLKDDEGETPLIITAMSNNDSYDIADLLIQAGADIDIVSDEGYTALICACENKHEDIAELLIERIPHNSAHLNENGGTGGTALAWACHNKLSEVAELLIEKGTDINIEDGNGNTPLSFAVETGNIEIVKLLIENGTDVNHESDGDEWAGTIWNKVCDLFNNKGLNQISEDIAYKVAVLIIGTGKLDLTNEEHNNVTEYQKIVKLFKEDYDNDLLLLAEPSKDGEWNVVKWEDLIETLFYYLPFKAVSIEKEYMVETLLNNLENYMSRYWLESQDICKIINIPLQERQIKLPSLVLVKIGKHLFEHEREKIQEGNFISIEELRKKFNSSQSEQQKVKKDPIKKLYNPLTDKGKEELEENIAEIGTETSDEQESQVSGDSEE
jgi:ankyrin repeat protein